MDSCPPSGTTPPGGRREVDLVSGSACGGAGSHRTRHAPTEGCSIGTTRRWPARVTPWSSTGPSLASTWNAAFSSGTGGTVIGAPSFHAVEAGLVQVARECVGRGVTSTVIQRGRCSSDDHLVRRSPGGCLCSQTRTFRPPTTARSFNVPARRGPFSSPSWVNWLTICPPYRPRDGSPVPPPAAPLGWWSPVSRSVRSGLCPAIRYC